MLTSGEEAYGAYLAAVEQREIADAIVSDMWARLHPAEQRAWEEVALLLALRQAYGHTLPVRRRVRAWCAVCQEDLAADTVRCPKHPEGSIGILFSIEGLVCREEKDSDATT